MFIVTYLIVLFKKTKEIISIYVFYLHLLENVTKISFLHDKTQTCDPGSKNVRMI